MASPTCEVKDGAGAYAPTTNGNNVTPLATIVIHLVSSADVDSWSVACVSTDDASLVETINAGLAIDSAAKTATFTAPVAGRALRFRSMVNGGNDRNGVAQASYSTTFCIYTTADGVRAHALDETTEGGLTGWGTDVNLLVRRDRALTLVANWTTTSTSRTTIGTPATVNGLSFAVEAGEVWEIEFKGTVQCSSTGGVKFAVTAPAASTVEGWVFSSTSAILTKSEQRVTAIDTLNATALHTVATTPGADRVVATITAAVAGTIGIQAASVTGGQTTTVFAGATLRARRLTAAI